jgi:S-methylmethionine-dependent homocysteine/selenocysteine methylase
MRSSVLNSRRNDDEDVAATMPDNDDIGDRWGMACSWLAMGGGTMAGGCCE